VIDEIMISILEAGWSNKHSEYTTVES